MRRVTPGEMIDHLRESLGANVEEFAPYCDATVKEALTVAYTEVLARLNDADRRILRDYARMRYFDGRVRLARVVLQAMDIYCPAARESTRPALRLVVDNEQGLKKPDGAATPPDGGNAA